MFLLVFLLNIILVLKYIGVSYVKDSFLKNEIILLLLSIMSLMFLKMHILKYQLYSRRSKILNFYLVFKMF